MNNDSEFKAPKALTKAQAWANALDTAVKIPFVPLRIGLDSLVGLIPGAGDALMLLAGLRIILLGKSMGMPKALISSMMRNTLIDFVLGFIPIVGDIADVFYKSNRSNVRIMEKWWVSNNKHNVDKNTAEKLKNWESQLPD